MKWAFIDYENVGSLGRVELATYEKVVVFLGAKQPKIDFGDKKYDLPINLILVQLKVIKSNNLDFHLSYYLGKYDSEAPNNVGFDIISNDNGFSPLIAHIKSNGRICKQVKLTNASIETTKLINSLKARSKEKRPQKVTTLRNHIASHMGIKGNEVAIQNHLNQLVNANLISISGDGIKYKS